MNKGSIKTSIRMRLIAIFLLTSGVAAGLMPSSPRSISSADSSRDRERDAIRSRIASSAIHKSRAFVIHAEGTSARCGESSAEEYGELIESGPGVPLHAITPTRSAGVHAEASGLRITLQGTQQLEAFPDAKAAFLRAATTWEGLIQTPISIIINVDFGPNRFGQLYPQNVLGSTDPQLVSVQGQYDSVRSAVIASAANSQEAALYNQLPSGSVPTDLGNAGAISAPTAAFRALGLMMPTADAASEAQFGPLPSIGFNSGFSFDFDPSNGIDADKFDFDAVATHEIGHALGFTSEMGDMELRPFDPLMVSIWDLFRFRPGISASSFATAERILSSGGAQVYFAGSTQLSLSTGRPNASGGDGYQGSHWKGAGLTGILVGIMDPAVPMGVHRTLTSNDLEAIHTFGYAVNPAGSGGGVGMIPLSSGVTVNGTIPASSAGSCTLGTNQYTIQVPSGATKLDIALAGSQSDAMLVRFGQAITVDGGAGVADFIANAAGDNQSISVTPTGTPSLQAGVYYIAVANCDLGFNNFTLTAIVTAPAGGGGGGPTPPSITNMTASLAGNTLTVSGTESDSGGDISKADLILLDASGAVVADTSPFPYSPGSAVTGAFTLQMANMQNFPSAIMARVLLFDSQGAQSSPVTADFGQGDSGGPQVTHVAFDDIHGIMIIKGVKLSKPVQVEVNGVVVNPPVHVALKGPTKLKVTGKSTQFNLHNGLNRVRLIKSGLRSNIQVISL
jgi:hypothetical protein